MRRRKTSQHTADRLCKSHNFQDQVGPNHSVFHTCAIPFLQKSIYGYKTIVTLGIEVEIYSFLTNGLGDDVTACASSFLQKSIWLQNLYHVVGKVKVIHDVYERQINLTNFAQLTFLLTSNLCIGGTN